MSGFRVDRFFASTAIFLLLAVSASGKFAASDTASGSDAAAPPTQEARMRRSLQPPDPHRIRQPPTPNPLQRRAMRPLRQRHQLPTRPNPTQRLPPPPPHRASPRRPNRLRLSPPRSLPRTPPTSRPISRLRPQPRPSPSVPKGQPPLRRCRRPGRRHHRTAARTCQWQVRPRYRQQEGPHADRHILFRPHLRAVVDQRRQGQCARHGGDRLSSPCRTRRA